MEPFAPFHRHSLLRCIGIGAAIAWCLVLGLVVVQPAAAALRACRTDPIVWLTNGQSVQMTVEIGTDASNVRAINYTLHAPVGTAVERIVYTGGALASKEQVSFVADLPANQYVTETVVTTRGNGHAVRASTAAAGAFRGAVSGLNGDRLRLAFEVP